MYTKKGNDVTIYNFDLINNNREKKYDEKKSPKNNNPHLTFFPTLFLRKRLLKLKTLQNLLKKVSKRIE